MDDSPRSSKRRRLDVPDTPDRTEPTPLAKSTLKRASGRLANRPVSYAVGVALEDIEEEVEGEKDASLTRKVKLPKKVANTSNHNGSPRKRTLAAGKDVYDDFEGALSPIPKRRAANTPRTGTSLPRLSKRIQITNVPTNGDISDDIYEANGIPKSQKTNGAAKGETPSRSAFREIVNGYKHGTEVDEETSDELAAEELPTKKRKNARAVNGSTKKLATTPRSVGRPSRTPAKALKDKKELEKSQTNGTNGITSSNLRSTKKVSTNTRKRTAPKTEEVKADVEPPSRTSRKKTIIDQPSTVPESEDELGDRLPPSRTMSAKAKRRSNRTDHIGNETEVIVTSDDEQTAGAAEDDDDLLDVDGGSILGSVLDPTPPRKRRILSHCFE
jgi:origin recognition complex subunit 4